MTTIEAENKELKKEVIRLRMIIMNEGAKWKAHHKDESKKKYWHDFMDKAVQ